MLRLLSSKARGCKVFRTPSKPCHVGTHWIALAEHSQMSTHVPGFQSPFRFLHHFVLAKLATSFIRVKDLINQAPCSPTLPLLRSTRHHAALPSPSSDHPGTMQPYPPPPPITQAPCSPTLPLLRSTRHHAALPSPSSDQPGTMQPYLLLLHCIDCDTRQLQSRLQTYLQRGYSPYTSLSRAPL